MPRPKVPASMRLRAAEACNVCRETKKKCSGTAPCTYCVRRGLGNHCRMAEVVRGSKTTVAVPVPPGHDPGAVAGAPRHAASQDTPPRAPRDKPRRARTSSLTGDPQPRTASDLRSRDGEARSINEAIHGSPTANVPRMLRNKRGEQVYVGGAASISFLQVVRNMVAERIGPSRFSHSENRDIMLEVGNAPLPEAGSARLDREDRLKYLRSYNAATEALILVFDPFELENLVLSFDADLGRRQSSMKRAAVMLVLAIGAQCQLTRSSQEIASNYFNEARRLAFAGFLEDPDLDMSRVFTLMAFYMFGACRRNAAFMYLGIAVKSALVLGLHSRESYGGAPTFEDQERLRVFMSICVMDKLVNALLGRPSSTACLRSNVKITLHPSQSPDFATDCLIAANNIANVISDVTYTVYDLKTVTVRTAEELLQSIDRWKRELPESLQTSASGVRRTTEFPPGASKNQPGALARVHISCFYYFAVALVTRPFLMAQLTARSARVSSSAEAQLAAACLDAAVYLAQTCAEAQNAGLLERSMCIMKALIFAAGLILGFVLFAKQNVNQELEAAFASAREVLKYLAAQSPQAAHYLEILNSLSEAIVQRQLKERGVGRSPYVSRIFGPDMRDDNGESSLAARDDLPWDMFSSKGGMSAMASSLDVGVDHGWSVPPQEIGGAGDSCLDWDSLDISQWDNFPDLA